jgi:hypothetical protein
MGRSETRIVATNTLNLTSTKNLHPGGDGKLISRNLERQYDGASAAASWPQRLRAQRQSLLQGSAPRLDWLVNDLLDLSDGIQDLVELGSRTKDHGHCIGVVAAERVDHSADRHDCECAGEG